MDKELIVRLARTACINCTPAGPADDGIDTWYGDQYLPSGALTRFAALVAEECAKVCDADGLGDWRADDIRAKFRATPDTNPPHS